MKLLLSLIGIYGYFIIFLTEKIGLSTDTHKLRTNSAKWRLLSDWFFFHIEISKYFSPNIITVLLSPFRILTFSKYFYKAKLMKMYSSIVLLNVLSHLNDRQSQSFVTSLCSGTEWKCIQLKRGAPSTDPQKSSYSKT